MAPASAGEYGINKRGQIQLTPKCILRPFGLSICALASPLSFSLTICMCVCVTVNSNRGRPSVRKVKHRSGPNGQASENEISKRD